jgi:hypothetical protein
MLPFAAKITNATSPEVHDKSKIGGHMQSIFKTLLSVPFSPSGPARRSRRTLLSGRGN